MEGLKERQRMVKTRGSNKDGREWKPSAEIYESGRQGEEGGQQTGNKEGNE